MIQTARLGRRGTLDPASTAGDGSPKGSRAVSWLLSATLVVSLTTVLCLFTPALWHWMTLPTAVAGILVGVDLVEWARGRLDVLQPRAVVAMFGFHLCYLAPLLHVAWDHWPRYIHPPQDWRTSLGILGLVNICGIAIYRTVLLPRSRPGPAAVLQLDLRRFIALGAVVISIGILALLGVMIKFGGPTGYLRIVSENRAALAGNGWLLVLAESWPLLLFALVVVSQRKWFRTHLLPLLIVLIAFIVVQFITGGLRGSRSNTVWPVIMALGLVHLIVRPLTRRTLLCAALAIGAFMYVYGFYKSVGADVLDLAKQHTSTTTLARETGRTLPLLLLEDFGRAGTQSIVIDRLSNDGQLSWGMTYVGDLAKLAPDFLVPNPPVDKSSAGTDLLYAPGAYDVGVRSSRIFGLVGEGMLNFGLVGGALAFLPFALFVRWADRVWCVASATGSLPLQLIAPCLSATCVLALGSDLDNVVWLIYGHVLPLGMVVLLLARRVGPKLTTVRDQ